MDAVNSDLLFLVQSIQNIKRLGGTKEVMAQGVSDLFNNDISFRKFILADPITFKGALESVLSANILSDSENSTKSTITLKYNDGLGEKSDSFSYSTEDGKYEFFRLAQSGETIIETANKNLEDFSQFLFNALKADSSAKVSFQA